MANQAKRPRISSPKEKPFSSASGYLHNVSDMKTFARGFSYFNAELQEENEITNVVGYREKTRDSIKQMELKRTPVKLANVERSTSWKNLGSFDIRILSGTTISPTKLNFPFESTQEQGVKPNINIKDVLDLPEGSKVSLSGKVLKQTNEQLTTIKRSHCGKRQLRESVKHEVICSVVLSDHQQNTTEYQTPQDVLATYVPTELHVDDKELFLLENNKVNFTVSASKKVLTSLVPRN